MDRKMKHLLHIGCGPDRKDRTTAGFAGGEWRETRLDIDPGVSPDIVGNIRDMGAVAAGSMDGVYASHVLEHLFMHEVPGALAECHRVLGPSGVFVVTSRDMQAVAEFIAKGNLVDPVCMSPAGPISPIDMVYGHRPALCAGQDHMALRCGFTRQVLGRLLTDAGFLKVAVLRRAHPYYDLWAIATRWNASDNDLRVLANLHFPSATIRPS